MVWEKPGPPRASERDTSVSHQNQTGTLILPFHCAFLKIKFSHTIMVIGITSSYWLNGVGKIRPSLSERCRQFHANILPLLLFYLFVAIFLRSNFPTPLL